MTNEDFVKKKEQLLFRAVASMSNDCDVPLLTPSCPFYELQADGTPICAEECKDVLAEGPTEPAAFGATALALGDDIAAVARPRPRRGPPPSERLFDAREIYLTELSRPIDSWSMASLLTGVRLQLTRIGSGPNDPPSLQRVHELRAELECRGIDFDAVVRHGLALDVISAILVHLDEAVSDGTDYFGWLDRLESLGPAGISGWLLSAELEDIFHHRVTQTVEELQDAIRNVPPRDTEIVWLVERFTETYVERWSKSSWKREHQYIHGERAGCCAPGHMRERSVDASEIATYLADVACTHIRTGEAHEDARPIDIQEFTRIALDALNRGDRAEAASIYRTIVRLRPGDNDVANNLGFCLLPDHPDEATSWLETAVQLAPEDFGTAMTHLNLAIAYRLCGEVDAARKAVDHARARLPRDEQVSFMWDLDLALEDNWKTTRVSSLSEYADSVEKFLDQE